MSTRWQIWIDTGGTFTDAVALAPDGATHRLKVLSRGCLRGRILEQLGPRQYRMHQRWGNTADIFCGYTFYALADADYSAVVLGADPVAGILTLDRDLSLPLPFDFEISAGEEAPVLAARLITATPLEAAFPPIDMRIGTTKGTNALLEKKGAGVALLITKGFGDLPAIGNQQRPHLFQLNIPAPTTLFEQVIEVEERLGADGEVLIPLTHSEIERVAGLLTCRSVAVAFLHAFRYPMHEIAMEQGLASSGIALVSLSHRLSPGIGLLARAQTVIVNAYLDPILHHYLQGISRKLRDASLLVMTSAGGLVSASAFSAKDSLLSGPAGGVVGAAQLARQMGFDRVLTLDMGGTSTDTARYDGRYDYRFSTAIDQITLMSPSLAIETVAAGGGSICYFDGRRMCVGPESAGAYPGPACYGAGGPLTITDVNLLLGKLDPSAMGIPVHIEDARLALNSVAEQLKQSSGEQYRHEEILRGFEQIANEKMADAIRHISVSRGFQPSDYALLAFGGAGGLHACRIADLLQMQTILLPYDSGLLSAYGIGMARVERFADKQVLMPLAQCLPDLSDIFESLCRESASLLNADRAEQGKIAFAKLLFMRFKGQHFALEVNFDGNWQAQFEQQYRRLFGYFPGHLPIEVESAKVIAAYKSVNPDIKAPAHRPFAQQHQSGHPVLHWESLPNDAVIDGPAILLNPFATAFIEEGWQLTLDARRNAVVKRVKPAPSLSTSQREAIALELFTSRFTAIAEEMGAQLQRTAFSVNIKERLDFSCALLDADARLLVNAPHIPVHLGSLGVCTRLVREAIAMGPGDIVITNHPRYGGSHLPDITLLCAVYTDAGELIGYAVNRAHHAEIGGKRPGSMPPDATSLAEEGVVFPPMYLVKDGELQWAAIEDQLRNAPFPTRALSDNLADLNAALASLRAGAEALRKLAAEHGLEQVRYYMNALQDQACAALDEALAPWRGRRVEAREQLDDDSQICVALEIGANDVLIDFTGSSMVHARNLNANIAIVYSAVIYVLRLLCQKEIPLNEGLMRKVQVVLPDNSLLHPHFSDDPRLCPAVVGGNTEVSQRLVDTLIKALGLAACSQGTMNNFLFGNDRFGYYETIGGGSGAGPGFNGRSAVHQHMTNTRITDPEDLEWRYPARLLRFAIRHGSGGAGQWQGGDGIVRVFEFLENVEMTLLSQHRQIAPYGMAGGSPGKTGRQYLVTHKGYIVPLNGADSRNLKAGDCVVIETPGGGGWGDKADTP